jgi:hypothetical protein
MINTYHGVDVCGARLLQEIRDFMAKHEAETGQPIRRVSLIGQ